jgi:hypothetical protein
MTLDLSFGERYIKYQYLHCYIDEEGFIQFHNKTIEKVKEIEAKTNDDARFYSRVSSVFNLPEYVETVETREDFKDESYRETKKRFGVKTFAETEDIYSWTRRHHNKETATKADWICERIKREYYKRFSRGCEMGAAFVTKTEIPKSEEEILEEEMEKNKKRMEQDKKQRARSIYGRRNNMAVYFYSGTVLLLVILIANLI